MRLRLILAGLGAALGALLVTGCVSATPHEGNGSEEGNGMHTVSDEELYEEGLENFRAFRASVAPTQRHLHDDEWIVDQYGAAPLDAVCEDGSSGYTFTSNYAVESVSYDVAQAPDALAEWLRGEGWDAAGVSAESAAGSGEAIVVVRASGDPSGSVQTLYVSFYESTQTVLVKAESVCFEGDASRLHSLIFPEPSATVTPLYPESELPGAEPVFRFAVEDGTAIDKMDDVFSDD